MFAGCYSVAFDYQLVVKPEQVVRCYPNFLVFPAVDIDLNRHVRFVLAAGPQVIGHGFDAQRRVTRRIPVGRVFAVVQQILHQPRRCFALRIGQSQQFEVIGLRFILAAVPAPPVPAVLQIQIGSLIFIVDHQVLSNVSHQHVALLDMVLYMQRHAEHGHAVYRKLGSVAIQKFPHLRIFLAGICQYHIHKRVKIIGIRFIGILFVRIILELAQLPELVIFQPLYSALNDTIINGYIILAGNLQAVHDIRRCMRP